MRTIRASEIGSFLFCQRAWWYRSQGIEPVNQDELLAGSALHRQHGRRILAADLLRALGLLVLLAALVLAAVYLTRQVL
jgi:CRISPR/Cas system-associated exonuclease Cas4 (RecB family)